MSERKLKLRSKAFAISAYLGITSLSLNVLIPLSWGLPDDSNTYRITTGDTLSEIAESRYGNWVKWHDLYTANRDLINNPDLIYPGQKIRLLSDEEIAFFKKQNGLYAANGGTGPYRARGPRSEEWRLLPTQSWERFVFKTSPEIDPQGFDRRSRVAVRVASDTNAEAAIASDRLAIHGEIVNARTEYSQIFLGEQVFVRADEELQVGSTYSVTSGPQKLSSTRDGRVGFAYDVMGRVRIIGVRDGLFIGTVTALYHPISRHNLLIPMVKSYPMRTPLAAPAAINATVLMSELVKIDLISEQKLVFLDVGTTDGVQPGMIFRHYLHKDPATREEISSRDFLIESELQVLDAQEKFSVALVVRSRSHLKVNDEVIALTDLSDYGRNSGMQTLIQDRGTGNTLDDLDGMDETQGLGEKEDRELRQLENYSEPKPPSTYEETSPETNEEIQVEGANGARGVDIGDENAPNDGTTQGPPPTANDPGAPAEPTDGDAPAEPTSEAEVSPAEPTPEVQSSTADPDPNTIPDTSVNPPEPSPEASAPPANDAELDGPTETTIEGSSTDPMAIPESTPVPSP